MVECETEATYIVLRVFIMNGSPDADANTSVTVKDLSVTNLSSSTYLMYKPESDRPMHNDGEALTLTPATTYYYSNWLYSADDGSFYYYKSSKYGTNYDEDQTKEASQVETTPSNPKRWLYAPSEAMKVPERYVSGTSQEDLRTKSPQLHITLTKSTDAGDVDQEFVVYLDDEYEAEPGLWYGDFRRNTLVDVIAQILDPVSSGDDTTTSDDSAAVATGRSVRRNVARRVGPAAVGMPAVDFRVETHKL
jgi:hypothetical protein